MKTFSVRVTPKAANNRIVEDRHENGDILYRVYITTVPEDGKANAAVIKLLAKHLGCAKSHLTITHGQTNRTKIISLTNTP